MVCKAENQPQRKHQIDRRARSLLATLEDGEPDDIFLTEALAATLGCSPQFLEIGRMETYAYGPAFVRIGASVGYRREDVCKWLRTRAAFFEASHPSRIARPAVRIISTGETSKRAASR